MKLGIKVGPRQESIADLIETKAQFCEVWFQINNISDYDELFAYLQSHHIDTGLHFWGLTKDGAFPSLAYDDPASLSESMDLIQKTIDCASDRSFSYVNIHPGYRRKISVEYKSLTFSKNKGHIVPYEEATVHFLDCMRQLTLYAKQKNVLLTVETTPIRLPIGSVHDTGNRRQVQDVAEYSYCDLPLSMLNFALANDFGHTAANYISEDPKPVWDFLFQKTIAYAPKTRLLHLGYIVPPYNGSDFHDQLDNPLFDSAEAIPNKNQMMELLKLFKNRDDVYALAEPNGQHPKNYFLAKKLLESV